MFHQLCGYNPLYDLKELQHALLTPARLMMMLGKEFHGNSLNPLAYTELGRSLNAAFVVMERITRDYPKPDFGIHDTKIDNKKVAVHQQAIVEKTFCRLLHFKKNDDTKQPKILIVAPMSGHYSTLLRGTVKDLLPHADVYITDWINARDVHVSEGSFDLDDYIDYVLEFTRLLGPDVHLLAVCQPAVPVLAAVSILSDEKDPKAPRTMTLIGGPIDARKSPTEVNQFAVDRSLKWFESHLISRVPYKFKGFLRPVYPGFLQLTGFMAMNLNRHIGEHVKLFQHLVEGDGESAAEHQKFYNEYLAVMDLPAEFYLQTVQTVFQDFSLPRRKMESRGRLIDPHAITKTALLTIEGERDDISGIGQTKAAIPLCKNLPDGKKKYHLQKEVGHYGTFNGRRFREQVVPVIMEFIREHG